MGWANKKKTEQPAKKKRTTEKAKKGKGTTARQRLLVEIDRAKRTAVGDLPDDGIGNGIGVNLVPGDKRPKLGYVGEQIRSILTGGTERAEQQALEDAENDEAIGRVPADEDSEIDVTGMSIAYQDTPYLLAIKNNGFHKFFADAKRWRPIVLAAMSMAPFVKAACRRAGISYQTYYRHFREDPIFAKQCDEAIDYARELLHMTAWRRAVEGNTVPVMYQGACVGYIQEYDTKLTVELLRGHLGSIFKPPVISTNNKIEVNTDNSTNIVITPERLAELRKRRKDALANRIEKPAEAREITS